MVDWGWVKIILFNGHARHKLVDGVTKIVISRDKGSWTWSSVLWLFVYNMILISCT